MKYITLIISMGLLLSFISCHEDEPVTPIIDEQSSGKLFLKIDKENAPESVVWIEAFLTRTNFDTISASMNLLSDSTADLLLEDLQSGEWHYKLMPVIATT